MYIYIYNMYYVQYTADIPCLYSLYLELEYALLTKYPQRIMKQDHSGAICRGEDENEL